jgi:HEAT repeat protein
MTLAQAALFLALAAPPGPGAGPTPRQPAAGAPADLSEAEVRLRLRALLGAIDTPVTEEDWRALGPRGPTVLAEIAASASEWPARRARAAWGLSVVGGPQAVPTLERLGRSSAESFPVRAAALEGLGRLLPPERLLAALSPVLGDPGEARVRAVTAEVLSRRAPQAACAAVRDRIASESPELRPMFHRAEAACGALERR